MIFLQTYVLLEVVAAEEGAVAVGTFLQKFDVSQ